MTTPRFDPVAATSEPTVELWSRLARPFDTAATVDALLGLSTDVVEQLDGVLVATCDEGETLLHACRRRGARSRRRSIRTTNDASGYCDRHTWVQDGVILAVIEELEHRGMRVPALRTEGGSLFAGPVEYIHHRQLGSSSRLHGIVIGNVLIDVPQRLKHLDATELQVDLEGRAPGRQVVPVTCVDDIVPAVDAAVRTSRSA